MTTGKQLAGLLLLTSALTHPGVALAQDAAIGGQDDAPIDQTDSLDPQGEDDFDDGDISIPGGTIVVTGRINRDPTRNSTQVLSVLSTEQIARTGEGNIAGALGRVTGLSVVGSGFVYVRGLGDRYSLALLNGSPLPSPEPLRRVVPLDIFPTGLVSSSLVQKSYSVNFPGEFGGGVINLTTRAIPRDSFVTVGVGGSWDSETTNQTGYSHYGSRTDWTGFENGQRAVHPALDAYFKSGLLLGTDPVDAQAIARELVTGRNAVVQRFEKMYPNFSSSLSAGHSFDVGDSTVGVIVGGGYSNRHTTRDALQQVALAPDLSSLEESFRRVTTDQRIVVNGLVGFGFDIGPHTIRWTNVFVRDTIKQTRLGLGKKRAALDPGDPDFAQQKTAWYERQLFDTQLVAELEPLEGLDLDIRYSYANSQREAPGELFFEYVRTNTADPYGAYFINRLNRNAGEASIAFSDLNEDLFSGGIDLSYEVLSGVRATVGAAFSDTRRSSSRRGFLFDPPSTFPTEIGLLRPDYLLQPTTIEYFGIGLVETDSAAPAFSARLENYAGYAKANIEFTPDINLDVGVRFETADQVVSPIKVFLNAEQRAAATSLSNDYWLPAATLTWSVLPELQLRVSGSKTIARPQFRELIYQPFADPDSSRVYVGNPLLVDSELYNAEARAEWYFAPDQRLSVSGFFKKIEKPIESFVYLLSTTQFTSFANAPQAQLYGAEVELQKYFDLDDMGVVPAGTRLVVVGNYTFTKSRLKVKDDDTVLFFDISDNVASHYFLDGAPLTGQSDHLVNLQIGLENQNRLSQQTFLLSYASSRVISRGLYGVPAPQADVVEKPGFNLDFVAREGFTLFGQAFEGKIEVRNILGMRHQEFQAFEGRRVDTNTYDVGTTFSGSISVTF